MNSTILNYELFFARLGSPNFMPDNVQLFFFAPYSLVGMILNTLTYLILNKKIIDRRIALFKYLKVYSLTSLIICSMIFLFVLTSIPRYTDLSYSYTFRIIKCHLMSVINSTFYLFGNLINLLIAFERLSSYVIRFQRLKCFHPYKLSFVLLCFCYLISSPLYFVYSTKSQQEFDHDKADPGDYSKISLCYKTNFGKSVFGQVVFLIVYFLISFAPFVLQIITDILSIVYYRRYIKNRLIIINKKAVYNIATILIRIKGVEDVSEVACSVESSSKKNQKKFKMNKNWTKMAIIFSIFCTISNFFSQIFGFIFVYSTSSNSQIYIYSYLFQHFFYLIKHANIFIILSVFCVDFRNSLKSLFK
jgi:hypothetical protein